MLDILVDPKMLDIFWSEYGFLKWSDMGFQGVSRRVTFRKSSLMGEVARYYSDDYIIRAPDSAIAGQQIIEKWKPAEDVMSHRILLVGSSSGDRPLHRSFSFGFKGWVEVLAYHPGDPLPVRKFSDLSTLVNNAGIIYGKLQEGINPVKERIVDFKKRGVVEGQPRKPAPFEVLKNLFRR
ncbi:MAG: hypothetical protein Q7I97_07525 [Thermovirgaceae bacterium]|nr:hypothetical protein [Thermovirgaceae bacterium]